MKTPRFSGPFKWSAVRQQLLSLREDIQLIRKIAGQNVTISEHPGKGTIINASRDRAVIPGCGCQLPAAGCAQVLCFGLELDAAEVEYGGQGGAPFDFASYYVIPYYADDGPGWYFETPSSELYIPFDPATIKDRLICFQLVLIHHDDPDQFESYLVIDGVQSDSVFDDADLVDDGSGVNRLRVGSLDSFGNITHRQISEVRVISTDTDNFPDSIVIDAIGSALIARVSPTETITSHPPDTHTTFTGSSISFSSGLWRVDTDSVSTSVFAEFLFCPVTDCRPAAPLRCCCSSALALLSGITTVTLDFTITGLCDCGDITLTKTWNRVSIDTTPEDEEFRFICSGGANRRADVDAGGPYGHGNGLVLVSNDYPNAGDFIEVRVPLGVFAGGPDFTQPVCQWSVNPCVTSGLTCVATSAWDSETTYAATALVNYLGTIFVSLQDDNLNHLPSDPVWWSSVGLPCSCATSPDFCLDTTLLDISDVPGEHIYTDTDRSCGSLTYDTTWTITFA